MTPGVHSQSGLRGMNTYGLWLHLWGLRSGALSESFLIEVMRGKGSAMVDPSFLNGKRRDGAWPSYVCWKAVRTKDGLLNQGWRWHTRAILASRGGGSRHGRHGLDLKERVRGCISSESVAISEHRTAEGTSEQSWAVLMMIHVSLKLCRKRGGKPHKWGGHLYILYAHYVLYFNLFNSLFGRCPPPSCTTQSLTKHFMLMGTHWLTATCLDFMEGLALWSYGGGVSPIYFLFCMLCIN